MLRASQGCRAANVGTPYMASVKWERLHPALCVFNNRIPCSLLLNGKGGMVPGTFERARRRAMCAPAKFIAPSEARLSLQAQPAGQDAGETRACRQAVARGVSCSGTMPPKNCVPGQPLRLLRRHLPLHRGGKEGQEGSEPPKTAFPVSRPGYFSRSYFKNFFAHFFCM